MRRNTMMGLDYQRMGLGRMIMKKCNDVADAASKATFANSVYNNKPIYYTTAGGMIQYALSRIIII